MQKKIKSYIMKMKNTSAPVKAAFWFTFCSIVNKCIQLITVPIFTRILTTTEYGQYSIFVSWQSILLIIATLNIYSNVFNNGMIKYPEEQDKFLSSMQGLTTSITIVLMFIFLCFREQLSAFIGLPVLLILILLAEIMLTPGYELWAAKQRFDFKYKKVVASTITLVILNPLLGLIFVWFSKEKGYARILSVLIVQIVIYGALYLNNFRRNKTFYNKFFWKYALCLAIPLVPHYLSQTLLNQMDRIMISDICGTDKAGIYSVAYSGAMILQIIGKSIQSAFTPWIYKKIHTGQTKEIKGVVNGLILLVGAMNLMLICLAPEVIAVLAGSKYAEAIYVIPPVTCSAYLIFVYSMFCTIEFYYEQTKAMMFVSIAGAVINYLTNYIFIKIYGYYAAGYTTLFCYLLFTLAHSFVMGYALKKQGYSGNFYDMKFILLFSAVFIIFGVLMSFVYAHIIIRYTILAIIGICMIINRNKLRIEIKNILNNKNK